MLGGHVGQGQLLPILGVGAFISTGGGQEHARAQQIAHTCDRIGLRCSGYSQGG